MLSNAKISLIRALHTKKGREKHGRCLVEGRKSISAAGDRVLFTFGRDDVPDFDALVTTETPQDIAAVAETPAWSETDVAGREAVAVLDGVQDPGNVGTIMRLCQAFGASALLVESADPTNPKAVRSSAGAMFQVPWRTVARDGAVDAIAALDRPVFRLERGDGDTMVLDRGGARELPARCVLVLGSEGSGISIPVEGRSLEIPHDPSLESLNVGHAAAIVLYLRSLA